MNRLALGTAQFGSQYGVANRLGKVSEEEAQRMISVARAFEIDMVDTASGYGQSEECLGAIGISDMKVVTKLSGSPVSHRSATDWVNSEFKASLLRLRVSSVYGLLVHHSSLLANGSESAPEIWVALQELKNRGLVKKIGVSIYAPAELDALLTECVIDLVQAPLNLIDQELIESGWLRRLKDAEVEVHVRSVFLQGLLLLSRKDMPQRFEEWGMLWDYWEKWQKSNDISAIQACLAFPLSVAGVDRVIVGADSVAQLMDIFQLSGDSLPSVHPKMRQTDLRLINPSKWSSL